MKKALSPNGSHDVANAIGLSPGIVSGDHVFLSGITGSGPDGMMPIDAEAQFRAAFEKVGAVLREADLGYDAIVEMTTYHIDIATHFETFMSVHKSILGAPYPAWTAVEVAGLRRVGALVEIRVVAALV